MALILPVTTDPLDSPEHSLLHRVVAIDSGACECAIIVENACTKIMQSLFLGCPGTVCGCLVFGNASSGCTVFVGGSGSCCLVWTLPSNSGSSGDYLSSNMGTLFWQTMNKVCVLCAGSSCVYGVCCVCTCTGSFVCCVDFGNQTTICANVICCIDPICACCYTSDAGSVCVWAA